MKISEKLGAARAFIQAGWCRGAYTKNKQNKETNPLSPDATRFCALGACRKIAGQGFMPAGNTAATTELVDYVKRAMPAKYFYVSNFNDSKRNKRDVLRLFDKAIVLAQADEGRTTNV